MDLEARSQCPAVTFQTTLLRNGACWIWEPGFSRKSRALEKGKDCLPSKGFLGNAKGQSPVGAGQRLRPESRTRYSGRQRFGVGLPPRVQEGLRELAAASWAPGWAPGVRRQVRHRTDSGCLSRRDGVLGRGGGRAWIPTDRRFRVEEERPEQNEEGAPAAKPLIPPESGRTRGWLETPRSRSPPSHLPPLAASSPCGG